MNPEYLEIENLNSFTDVQTVDFTAFRADRLFCICGDTGAGKTTVLDAIIVALYGIDRGKDDERSKKTDYINVKADRARVAFSFTMGKSYKVERVFARNGANKAYFYENGTLVANGADQVNPAVEAAVGLTKEEFTQVIILQQGAFSKFLTAKAGERTDTVGKLFRLGKFDLHAKVNKAAGEYKLQLSALEGELKSYEGITGALVAEEKRKAKALQKTVAEYRVKCKAAAETLVAVREKKRKYDEYLAAVAARDAAEKTLLAIAEKLRQATAVSPEALEQAATAAEGAARDAEQAKQTFLRQKKAAEQAAELTKIRDGMREDYKKAEAACKQLTAERQRAETQVDRCTEQAKQCAARMAQAAAAAGTEYGGDTATLMQTASRKAAELTLAAAEYGKQIEKKNEAVELATALTLRIEATEKMLAEAQADELAKKDALARERRNSAAAAVLEGLHDGDACPVCGGTVKLHDVTSDVDKAERAYEAAQERTGGLKVLSSDLRTQFRAAKKEADAAVEKPADPAPFERLAEAARESLDAEKVLAAAQKTLSECDGKLAAAEEKKESLRVRGVETTEHINRYAAEAGECVGRTQADLNREEKQLETAAAELQAAAVEARKAAKETSAAQLRLSAEKAKAEGEYAAAVKAVVEVEAVSAEAVAAAERAVETLTEEQREAERAQATAEKISADDAARWEKKKALDAERAQIAAKFDTADRLARLLKDKALVKFVAEEYIRAFTAAASNRLNRLSGGKYTLSYEDGGFSIGDYLNGNLKRRVVTLSGGETFLASLSMAAAISDMLASGAGYGFFFLDEGFGTLDESKLDQVYEALVALSRDTLVGVVTHSERLIEKIPARITVSAADGERGSRIV